jgi:hypothetical protein
VGTHSKLGYFIASVIIYITKCNQTLSLAWKRTDVSVRQKGVQTTVGSDIGLPYNASGRRGKDFRMGVGLFSCPWVLFLATEHATAPVLLPSTSSLVSHSQLQTSIGFYSIPNPYQHQIAQLHNEWHEFFTFQPNLKVVKIVLQRTTGCSTFPSISNIRNNVMSDRSVGMNAKRIDVPFQMANIHLSVSRPALGPILHPPRERVLAALRPQIKRKNRTAITSPPIWYKG